jgi:hypothetical protein
MKSVASIVAAMVLFASAPVSAIVGGGLTGVTPLTLYRDWILRAAGRWGFAL